MNLTGIARPAMAAAIVALSAAGISVALAQVPTTIQSGPVQAVVGSAQRITMTMGKGQLFKTPVPFTKISVSDEKIVDVTPQSNREFVFTPKAIGSTNVFVFDEKNTLISTLDINVVSQTPAQEVRGGPYDEMPRQVRIYNVPWRGGGAGATQGGTLTSPAHYQCGPANCELVKVGPNPGPSPLAAPGPNAGPGPSEPPAPSPRAGGAGAPTDNENTQ